MVTASIYRRKQSLVSRLLFAGNLQKPVVLQIFQLFWPEWKLQCQININRIFVYFYYTKLFKAKFEQKAYIYI